jgi:alcohol dehydrogenase, propanol-preferring
MRAMRLERPAPIERHPLVASEVTDLAAGPGELLLRVSVCAVCRTDLQICEGDVPTHRLPIVPGHQVVGTVAEVGAGVADWSPGDRAGVAWLGYACGTCAYCTSGRENLCPEAKFTGWDLDGGYAQTLRVQAAFALHVPERFTDLQAAPLLCGGIIGYRALKRSGIQRGQRLGLFGFGASARLAIQLAAAWECEIYVVTRSPAEQAQARQLGAVWAGDYAQPIPAPLDAAVTFAPVGSAVVAALTALAPGGTVAANAIHLDHIPEFSYDLLWRERSVTSVANFTRQDAREFLALAAEIPIIPAVEQYPLAQANEVLARHSAGGLSATAVLVPDEPARV